MTEPDYLPPISELLTFGDCRQIRGWPDYLALGLGSQHIPDLIRMAMNEELHWADEDGLEVWAPIHAWRALGQLRAEAAVEPFTRLLARIDEFDDAWVGEDLPKAFGLIGPAALPALRDYLADPSHGLWARVAAVWSLAEIGKQHPDARTECIAALAGQLEQFVEQDPTLNGFIVCYLLDLKAVEAAPVIERAFAADCVDLSILGDWEDAQIRLGLLQERQTPPPRRSGQGLPWGQKSASQSRAKRSGEDKRRKKRKQQRQARKRSRKRK